VQVKVVANQTGVHRVCSRFSSRLDDPQAMRVLWESRPASDQPRKRLLALLAYGTGKHRCSLERNIKYVLLTANRYLQRVGGGPSGLWRSRPLLVTVKCGEEQRTTALSALLTSSRTTQQAKLLRDSSVTVHCPVGHVFSSLVQQWQTTSTLALVYNAPVRLHKQTLHQPCNYG
jgi:hypothetical protein